MLSILCVRITIKVKVGTPESFKVRWYPPKKTGSSHLKIYRIPNIQESKLLLDYFYVIVFENKREIAG